MSEKVLSEVIKQIESAKKTPIAVVLGSGLSSFTSTFTDQTSIDFCDIPTFPKTTVPGHDGRLISTIYKETPLLIFSGRFHLYEGLTVSQICCQVSLAATLGCKDIILSNASGGILPQMIAGDLLMVSDHINLTGENPLIGIIPPAFVDMSNIYSCDHFAALAKTVKDHGNTLHKGILVGLTGPSYETPAEIIALESIGVAAVSMSTVNEAIMARYLGLRLTALSLISNKAAGLEPETLNHKDVLSQASKSNNLFNQTLHQLVDLISISDNSSSP